MSVERSFKKSMKETGFVETMESIGFTLAQEHIWFYRKRGDFIDSISFQPLAAGKGVRCHVSVYTPIMFPDYDFRNFPRGFSKLKTNITKKYINNSGVSFSSGNWDTSGVGRFEKTFNALTLLLESEVLPWFEAINTNEKLYQSIFEDYKSEGQYDYLLPET